jgi:hypothetical protein
VSRSAPCLRVGVLLVLGVCGLLLPDGARAQSAWVPGAGESGLSFTFQTLNFAGHFDEHGNRLEGAIPSRAFVGIVEFEHGITDRLAITARLPYIASRFTGDQNEPVTALLRERYEEFRRTHPGAAVTSLDTGEYYATFQDFGFTARYNLIEGVVAVTPVIGVTIPSHDYQTVGEAAPGQNLRALHTGVNVGALLYPMLRRGYVHGRYTYSFVESLAGVPLDRSSAEFEIGYAITPRVSVRGLFDWMHTHGGVPFSVAYEDVELFLVHDRLLASRYWHFGGGTTLSLTDSLDLDAAIVTFLSGSDTHYGVGATLGLSWHFHTGGGTDITASASASIPHRQRSGTAGGRDRYAPRRRTGGALGR